MFEFQSREKHNYKKQYIFFFRVSEFIMFYSHFISQHAADDTGVIDIEVLFTNGAPGSF